MAGPNQQKTNLVWLPLLTLVVFTVINFSTGTRYPTAWQDEVLYTDPAANLYFGHGFTSSAWPAQPYGTFWAGNVPLHQFILTGWFHLFGFGLLQARSLNYCLIVAAVIMLWLGWRRSGLIRSQTFSALGFLLILCGTGITISYRSARPDCIAILLLSIAFHITTLTEIRRRRRLLCIVGIFFPIAGIQLVIFSALLCGLIVLWTRGKFFKDFLFPGTGIIIGGGLLAALYASQGVFHQFVLGVTKYSNIGIPPQSLETRLHSLPSVLTGDKTQAGLVAIACFLLVARQIGWIRFTFNRLAFAVIAWFVVITTMLILNKFPVYYSWMTSIPLGICLASAFEEIRHQKRFILYIAIVGCLAVSAPGFPMKMAVTAWRWRDRDIKALDAYVQSNSGPANMLLADYTSYFGEKNSSNVVVVLPYLEAATDEEKARIQLAIIRPSLVDRLTNDIGPGWSAIAPEFSHPWRALNSPDAAVRRFAHRAIVNAQDLDWQLGVYQREAIQGTPVEIKRGLSCDRI